MIRTGLNLLLILMLCLAACSGAIEEEDDTWDEPIGETFEAEQKELDDEPEDLEMEGGRPESKEVGMEEIERRR